MQPHLARARENNRCAFPAGSTPGSYTVEYTICLEADSSICDTAEVSIVVAATPTISANNDDFSASPIDAAVGGTTASVFDDNGNGTDISNGIPASDSNINDNISITNNGGLAGVTINSDGTINIPVGAPAGSYTVTYQICLNAPNQTVCDTATVNIVVVSIDAIDDDFTSNPIDLQYVSSGGNIGSINDTRLHLN